MSWRTWIAASGLPGKRNGEAIVGGINHVATCFEERQRFSVLAKADLNERQL